MNEHSTTGIFIVFEGGDGTGKTTQSELLVSWLKAQGHRVTHTREPGGTELGAKIRELLLHGGDVSPRAEALLYAADRAHHINTLVIPALERGEVVVQDRYIDSSVAYQGAGRVLGAEDIEQLSMWAAEGLTPQLTVLLDLDAHTAAQRRQGRGAADRLEQEKLEFHETVREAFLARAREYPERYLVLDAAADADSLHERIVSRVATFTR